jgi:hypothetical protein
LAERFCQNSLMPLVPLPNSTPYLTPGIVKPMRLALIISVLGLLHGISAPAQQAPFEKQWVMLADGSEVEQWISLDEKSETLYYKTSANAPVASYTAAEVVRFHYGRQHYFSLPLKEAYFTYFKVYHEASEFAILEKVPSIKVLQLLAKESKSSVTLCQTKKSNDYYLCHQITTLHPGANGHMNSSTSETEIDVRKMIYLALEGKVKLLYMETDDRFSFWDEAMNTRPGMRQTEKIFQYFIEDPHKRAAILDKIILDRLDIRDPQHLILALEAVYF